MKVIASIQNRNCKTVEKVLLNEIEQLSHVSDIYTLVTCQFIADMDFARVFQCVVCTTKHLISRREKKKMMMNSIDSNIDITLSISKLTCLSEASPVQHFLTTRLQYRTLKLLCAICSILVKLFKKHSLYTGYKIRWTGGPLNCYQRSELLKELCDKIVKHSYILGEHFLKIDTDENS